MKLYENAQQYINNKMDVINYLSFIQEFMYLKCFMFDEITAICLGLTKNPKLYDYSKFHRLNKDNKETIEKIVKFYVINNQNLSQQEKKVYDILADDIKDLITKFKS